VKTKMVWHDEIEVWRKYCEYMYINGKIIPVETIPGKGVEGIKENDGRGWIQVWSTWYIVRTFVNATMYPHPVLQ
jgi:hypothetical protein